MNAECVLILTSTFVRIMKAYDANIKGFQIVRKSVALTIDGVALIFGLHKKRPQNRSNNKN